VCRKNNQPGPASGAGSRPLVLGGDGERKRYDVEFEVDIAEMREQDERDPRLRARLLEPKLTCLAGRGRALVRETPVRVVLGAASVSPVSRRNR
jgi:hypothetical protein